MTKTERLEAEIHHLRSQVIILKVSLGLWSCTFSKYLSWRANNVPVGDYRPQVCADYEKCNKVTNHLWEEL